ncbi:hypothetical protein HYH02_006740 [Chlamydomonas schloesseri]|uniref:Uncharacterized protein n=1 Tax=Chlamydomonas schloesseri TaxID=2026947 RepID=A0A835WJT8_9CHLO|nr:hypothetical protein HYH02_006740 [Chlamydomonas schloesseri]|eukprot:KAG2448155.1 hypothetical protein HYH02_006740 [Chlamydomonas schloesseri]
MAGGGLAGALSPQQRSALVALACPDLPPSALSGRLHLQAQQRARSALGRHERACASGYRPHLRAAATARAVLAAGAGLAPADEAAAQDEAEAVRQLQESSLLWLHLVQAASFYAECYNSVRTTKDASATEALAARTLAVALSRMDSHGVAARLAALPPPASAAEAEERQHTTACGAVVHRPLEGVSVPAWLLEREADRALLPARAALLLHCHLALGSRDVGDFGSVVQGIGGGAAAGSHGDGEGSRPAPPAVDPAASQRWRDSGFDDRGPHLAMAAVLMQALLRQWLPPPPPPCIVGPESSGGGGGGAAAGSSALPPPPPPPLLCPDLLVLAHVTANAHAVALTRKADDEERLGGGAAGVLAALTRPAVLLRVARVLSSELSQLPPHDVAVCRQDWLWHSYRWGLLRALRELSDLVGEDVVAGVGPGSRAPAAAGGGGSGSQGGGGLGAVAAAAAAADGGGGGGVTSTAALLGMLRRLFQAEHISKLQRLQQDALAQAHAMAAACGGKNQRRQGGGGGRGGGRSRATSKPSSRPAGAGTADSTGRGKAVEMEADNMESGCSSLPAVNSDEDEEDAESAVQRHKAGRVYLQARHLRMVVTTAERLVPALFDPFPPQLPAHPHPQQHMSAAGVAAADAAVAAAAVAAAAVTSPAVAAATAVIAAATGPAAAAAARPVVLLWPGARMKTMIHLISGSSDAQTEKEQQLDQLRGAAAAQGASQAAVTAAILSALRQTQHCCAHSLPLTHSPSPPPPSPSPSSLVLQGAPAICYSLARTAAVNYVLDRVARGLAAAATEAAAAGAAAAFDATCAAAGADFVPSVAQGMEQVLPDFRAACGWPLAVVLCSRDGMSGEYREKLPDAVLKEAALGGDAAREALAPCAAAAWTTHPPGSPAAAAAAAATAAAAAAELKALRAPTAPRRPLDLLVDDILRRPTCPAVLHADGCGRAGSRYAGDVCAARAVVDEAAAAMRTTRAHAVHLDTPNAKATVAVAIAVAERTYAAAGSRAPGGNGAAAAAGLPEVVPFLDPAALEDASGHIAARLRGMSRLLLRHLTRPAAAASAATAASASPTEATGAAAAQTTSCLPRVLRTDWRERLPLALNCLVCAVAGIEPDHTGWSLADVCAASSCTSPSPSPSTCNSTSTKPNCRSHSHSQQTAQVREGAATQARVLAPQGREPAAAPRPAETDAAAAAAAAGQDSANSDAGGGAAFHVAAVASSSVRTELPAGHHGGKVHEAAREPERPMTLWDVLGLPQLSAWDPSGSSVVARGSAAAAAAAAATVDASSSSSMHGAAERLFWRVLHGAQRLQMLRAPPEAVAAAVAAAERLRALAAAAVDVAAADTDAAAAEADQGQVRGLARGMSVWSLDLPFDQLAIEPPTANEDGKGDSSSSNNSSSSSSSNGSSSSGSSSTGGSAGITRQALQLLLVWPGLGKADPREAAGIAGGGTPAGSKH